MKKFTLLLPGILAAQLSYGQQTEVSVHLPSGLSNFRGAGAQRTSLLYFDGRNPSLSHTLSPYGKQLGWVYGATGQVQRLTQGRALFGLQAGYEVLQSRVRLQGSFSYYNDFAFDLTGHTTLANHSINVHPFVGRRYRVAELDLDLTAGPEIGVVLRSHEKGEASHGSSTYASDLNLRHPALDARARLNLTAYYHRVGVGVGYSCGLSDYSAHHASSNRGAYTQTFRLGLAYRLVARQSALALR